MLLPCCQLWCHLLYFHSTLFSRYLPLWKEFCSFCRVASVIVLKLVWCKKIEKTQVMLIFRFYSSIGTVLQSFAVVLLQDLISLKCFFHFFFSQIDTLWGQKLAYFCTLHMSDNTLNYHSNSNQHTWPAWKIILIHHS